MNDEYYIKDGEIHEQSGEYYAIYEFQSPLSDAEMNIAKRALLYKARDFIEKSDLTEFYLKIIIHPQFRQVPNFLGRNEILVPTVAVLIQKANL